DVGQGGLHLRRPVDQPLGPVDQPVVAQLLEDRLDGAGEPLVHGEALAGPVDAVTHAAHLGQDGPAVLLLPLPHALDEGFPAEVAVVDALVPQLLLHQRLHGDAGVVHTGQPQRLVPLHAAAPDQQVHQGVLVGVPDVQAAGDVRRRDDDRERRLVAVRVGGEITGFYPALVQLGLYVGWIPGRRKFTGLRRMGLSHTPNSTSGCSAPSAGIGSPVAPSAGDRASAVVPVDELDLWWLGTPRRSNRIKWLGQPLRSAWSPLGEAGSWHAKLPNGISTKKNSR